MTDLVLGSEFAGYVVEAVVGRGGMGVIYRARDPALDRPVAIKLIGEAHAADPELRHRFEREARLMAALDHPNVIPVYTAGEEDGQLYLVMRYVDGTDLQHQLRARGRLSALEAARIVDQVGHALDAAHARGLVHRDIKPANVLLAGDHVYLTDFGITRLIDEGTGSTESGRWLGTVDYMSPEHLRGEPTDALSDVYSLGCLLYTCLAGTPPFHRETIAATMAAQLGDRPPKVSQTAGVPKRFDDVLRRALAKRPRDRYQSAGRLGTAALAAAQGGRGSPRRFVPAGVANRAPARTSPAAETAATRLAPPTQRTALVGEESTRVAHGATAGAGVAAPAARRRSNARPGAREAAVAADPTRVGRTSGDIVGRFAVWGAVLAILVAVIVAIVIATDHEASGSSPLTSGQISAVVHRFAAAYAARDSRSLGALLAPGVTRVDASSTQHGRAQVVGEYEQQFRTKPVPEGYELSKLSIAAGWAGRASGDYTVTLSGGSTLTGHVTFGVESVGGHVAIGLIATDPNQATTDRNQATTGQNQATTDQNQATTDQTTNGQVQTTTAPAQGSSSASKGKRPGSGNGNSAFGHSHRGQGDSQGDGGD